LQSYQITAPINTNFALQDGLLDGLTKLESVNFESNLISSIGIRVFGAAANLTRLRFINVALNKLESLEPWPMIRGQLVPGSEIRLHDNIVSTFTNQLGWHFKCGERPRVVATVSLKWNSIRHVTDLTDNWNITSK
jgi:hypothetical protein